jgi:hypothetical protein
MQAEVIELLSAKGKFPTEQALALVEAIDMAIEKTQLVTVPVMDVRFAAVDRRFTAVDARFERLEARMDSGFVAVNARIDALEARMDAKMERWAVRLVIAMLVSQTALGPIGMSALDAVRRVLSTFVR